MSAWWCSERSGVLSPCDDELNTRLEAAFQAFLKGGEETAEMGSEALFDVNFCTLRAGVDAASAGRGQLPLRRYERAADAQHAAAPGADGAAAKEYRIEWGHGQDPVNGSGVAPFRDEIADLLEADFAKFREGRVIKGILFTADNAADYVVDFDKMQQMRVATRRLRPVYRHAVGEGWRGAVPAAPSQAAHAAPAAAAATAPPRPRRQPKHADGAANGPAKALAAAALQSGREAAAGGKLSDRRPDAPEKPARQGLAGAHAGVPKCTEFAVLVDLLLGRKQRA